MTTVITRFFETPAKARAVREELINFNRFSFRIISIFEDPDTVVEGLTSARVEEETARAYRERLETGGAVMMVTAGYRPLGVAQTTRDVTGRMGAVDMGALIEEVTFKDRDGKSSVMRDHPYIMSRPRDPESTTYHMANWPIPLISRRKPGTISFIPRHGRMANWPIPLLSGRKPFTASIIPRHARMANFPIRLISKRKPFTKSLIPRHGRMANFPIPLINRRKPIDATWIGRHTRMANWPFPHLINGKTGTNALMPGGPRMAAYPIELLSDRKPYDEMMIPRHGRMANFPIPLISKRKPFDEFAFPRHARMADLFLPLVLRREDTDTPDSDKRFSFSRLLRIPTLIKR
ncbi:MAG: PucR family transcriptional regulator [Pseudomonadota bacterium]